MLPATTSYCDYCHTQGQWQQTRGGGASRREKPSDMTPKRLSTANTEKVRDRPCTPECLTESHKIWTVDSFSCQKPRLVIIYFQKRPTITYPQTRTLRPLPAYLAYLSPATQGVDKRGQQIGGRPPMGKTIVFLRTSE